MAIIVKDTSSGQRYILLGSGFGMYKSVSPSFLGGTLLPNEEEGSLEVVCVSDGTGHILFKRATSLKVVEVDGAPIESFGDKLARESVKSKPWSFYESCPGCQADVAPGLFECPECGLRLR